MGIGILDTLPTNPDFEPAKTSTLQISDASGERAHVAVQPVPLPPPVTLPPPAPLAAPAPPAATSNPDSTVVTAIGAIEHMPAQAVPLQAGGEAKRLANAAKRRRVRLPSRV